ncbi:MAG: hypothetical protein K2K38_00730 [Clostridia bacterium]|nr:hypothetical protein [Clostridia bacterium]
MSKRFTKIICAITASTFMLGAVAVAGCSNYYSSKPLDGDYSYDKVYSNGGFAVEAGNYVYYINGVTDGKGLNDFGKPVKGAIYRVSKDNLKAKNYSSVQKVVPSIAYSTDYNAGIFIYGDRIYYGTPSTAKNSDGVVQNSYLDMKSSKLDGTETLKNAYVSFPSASYEYRFVEVEGTVYLLYIATSEKLYDESTGVTNIHSYNTSTGADTLLAYNVNKVIFDSEDKTNPSVFYTMSVYDYTGTSNTAYGYNQLYTVKADATEDKFAGKLNKDTVPGWDDTDRYINCGELVLDGIGYSDYLGKGESKTPFNYAPETKEVNEVGYTYELKQYVNGSVYYTRTTSLNSTAYLFSVKDNDLKPIENNNGTAILSDGSNADKYKFVTVGENKKDAVLYVENSGITINYFENGKLGDKPSDLQTVDGKTNTYYPVVKKNAETILHVDDNYLYYSDSDNKIYRVNYTGSPEQYNDANLLVDKSKLEEADENGYAAVQILDLAASSSWYAPEFIGNYIFFASMTSNMTNYNYIMVFDLPSTTVELRALNKLYKGVEKKITEVYGDTDKYPSKNYANVQNALKYAFYNGDYAYLKEYAKELNGALKADADLIYSEQTFAEYDNFLKAEGVWAEYGGDNNVTVNGNKVYANNHDYYYSVLGEMSGEDKDAYAEGLKTSYLYAKAEEEPEVGWYDGLKTVEKVFFVIGMCLIGACVLGGGAWLTVYLVRRKKKQPEQGRRRIKVDTTDDKSVDVYDTQE